MRFSIGLFFVLVISLLPVCSLPAEAPDDVGRDVEGAFRSAMAAFGYGECWRLWDGATRQSKLGMTQADFCGRLAKGGRRSAAGRGIEDVMVQVNSQGTAVVYARIGVEPKPGSPDTVARSFIFMFEDGAWRHQLGDFLGLAQ